MASKCPNQMAPPFRAPTQPSSTSLHYHKRPYKLTSSQPWATPACSRLDNYVMPTAQSCLTKHLPPFYTKTKWYSLALAISLPDCGQHHSPLAAPTTPAMANLATHSATKKEQVAFMHATMLSPAISTLQQALDNNWLTGLPGLTSTTLKQHTPHSKATTKGHLDQARKNQKSTKPKPSEETEALEEDCSPTRSPPGMRTHCCYAIIIDLNSPQGQISTDQSARFPPPPARATDTCFACTTTTATSLMLSRSRTGKLPQS